VSPTGPTGLQSCMQSCAVDLLKVGCSNHVCYVFVCLHVLDQPRIYKPQGTKQTKHSSRRQPQSQQNQRACSSHYQSVYIHLMPESLFYQSQGTTTLQPAQITACPAARAAPHLETTRRDPDNPAACGNFGEHTGDCRARRAWARDARPQGEWTGSW